MSGTSLDGIDAVLVEFHGDANDASRLIKTAYQPYSAQLREQLLELHRPSHNELERAACIGNTLATAYAVTVNSLLKTTVIRPNQITAIGCHGQTVRHRPDLGFSLQLGNPALLAELAVESSAQLDQLLDTKQKHIKLLAQVEEQECGERRRLHEQTAERINAQHFSGGPVLLPE